MTKAMLKSCHRNLPKYAGVLYGFIARAKLLLYETKRFAFETYHAYTNVKSQ